MPSDPPVDFQALAQGATGQTNADYPYSIKATDLMKDFVFATLDIAEGVYEETAGLQGHRQRRLKIPTPPETSITSSLQSVGGIFSWGEGGGITREYFVAINGTLYKEGFKCATEDVNGNEYPIEVTE
jgi:hypothetical protein